jgi:SAM-dependent methyltransferase
MTDIRDHYESLLASVYTWMSGGREARLDANRSLFRQLGIQPGRSGLALDLGAGSGFQSIPLAELGFQVTAVDLSPTLIAELRTQVGSLQIRTVERNFLPLTTLGAAPVDLIVCMGDTLTHLADPAEVQHLITEAAAMLHPGGALVLTWRDLSTLPEGNARFLPIRSDADRIFTCFLETIDAARVRVHDIVHERAGAGFTQRISSYTKLRLAPAWVDRTLTQAGFAIETATAERGLLTRLARKPT